MMTRDRIGAAHVAAVVFALAANAAMAQQYGTNLLVNPGAEQGPASPNGSTLVNIPGWDTFGDGFTVVAYGTAGFPTSFPGSGRNFFVGGADSQFSTASQTINLNALAGDIERGGVAFQLSAQLGGAGSQDDSASITLLWLNAAGNSIGTSGLLGPLAGERGNQTRLLTRSTQGLIPPQTKSVVLVLFMARNVGTFNDASADNISLTLTQPPCEPDINQDGNVDQGDLDYLINVLAGGSNPVGADPDFNRDGNADQGDIDALVNVVAGGACP